MTDLFGQLRAYGRQIETDLDSGASDGLAPGRSLPATPDARSGRRSRRSPVLSIAAVTAAIALTGSLVLAPQLGDGNMDNKPSGIVIGTCLFLTGCTSDTDGAGSTVAPAGQPTAVLSSTPSSITTAITSSAITSSAIDPAGTLPNPFDSDRDLDPGRYAFDLAGTQVEITVPQGWKSLDQLLVPQATERLELGQLGFFEIKDVYRDACRWQQGGEADIGPTVHDAVAAFVAQDNVKTSAPKAVTVDGVTGTELVMSTPPNLDLTTCPTGRLSLSVGYDGLQEELTEGDSVTMWLLDLNGKRVTVSFHSTDAMPTATKAQLEDMLASVTFG